MPITFLCKESGEDTVTSVLWYLEIFSLMIDDDNEWVTLSLSFFSGKLLLLLLVLYLYFIVLRIFQRLFIFIDQQNNERVCLMLNTSVRETCKSKTKQWLEWPTDPSPVIHHNKNHWLSYVTLRSEVESLTRSLCWWTHIKVKGKVWNYMAHESNYHILQDIRDISWNSVIIINQIDLTFSRFFKKINRQSPKLQ